MQMIFTGLLLALFSFTAYSQQETYPLEQERSYDSRAPLSDQGELSEEEVQMIEEEEYLPEEEAGDLNVEEFYLEEEAERLPTEQ